MKRLDLHIHTCPTSLEEQYEFDIEGLAKHVVSNGLDAIAITNHNMFDLENYRAIGRYLNAVEVFPGIEVSVESFHVLVIANPLAVEDFKNICANLKLFLEDKGFISIDQFRDIFGDGSYVVIPHYKKDPSITSEALSQLSDIVSALEVSSPKKWMAAYNNIDKPIVLFSDFRCCRDSRYSSGRYTYVAGTDVSFDALRLALKDKAKFHISAFEDKFELAPNLYASTGLNVVIGGRSSGKTYLLDGIASTYDVRDVKYVRQFDIIRNATKDKFEALLKKETTNIRSAYFSELKKIADAAAQLPTLDESENTVKTYLTGLKEYAETTSRADAFSNCPINTEEKLPLIASTAEAKVVEAIICLLDDNPLSQEINELLSRDALLKLLAIAIGKYKDKEKSAVCRKRANKTAEIIGAALSEKSARPQCPVSPLVDFASRNEFIKRLAIFRGKLTLPEIIARERVGHFEKLVQRVQYKDATALKNAIGSSQSLSGILKKTDTEFIETVLSASGGLKLEYAFLIFASFFKMKWAKRFRGDRKLSTCFSVKSKMLQVMTSC